MTLVVFGSHRGAPGATTTGLLAAALWPTPPGMTKAFVEADPAGGVLALRFGLGVDPGLTSMAAAARHGAHRGALVDHCQELPGGLGVVCAPATGDVTARVLDTSAASMGEWLSGLGDTDVIADVGRFGSGTAAAGLIAAADVVVFVARPVPDQLHPGAAELTRLRTLGLKVGWCLIGDRPYGPGDVEDSYGFPVFGVVDVDDRAAAMVWSQAPARKIVRTGLARSTRDLVGHLHGWLHPESAPPAARDHRGPAVDTDAGTSTEGSVPVGEGSR